MVIALAWMLIAHPLDTTRAVPAEGWIRTWIDRDGSYDQGEPVRVFLRLDRPGYVTALRVDTDGRVRVLFPKNPWGDNYVDARRTFEITSRHDDYAFAVDEDAGVGYVLVIASPRPFNYNDISRDDYWDYRFINSGRIRGDPYVALTDLAERIAPDNTYAYDITSYYVGGHYDYPRFVCAQCHSHPRDREWEEYRLRCARFRLVIYDDPAYYPYRYGRGRNVVLERPLHPGPRFVFRDAARGADYVTRLRGRADEADQRRARELSPARPLIERHRVDERRREERRRDEPGDAVPRRARPDADRTPNDLAPVERDSDARPARRPSREPQSIGGPELRRRKR